MSAAPKKSSAKYPSALYSPNPQHARQSNLQAALLAILRSKKPISRAEIATSIGCTRATASKLADQLISARIVEEQRTSTASTPGRPAVPLRLVRRRFISIGVEINVGYIAIRIVDLNGDTLIEITEEKSLTNSNPAQVLTHLDDRLTSLISEFDEEQTSLVGATIAVPGLVDTNRKLILRAPNLNWSEIRPCDHMQFCKQLKNVQVLNEANTAATASAYSRPGIPSKNRNFLYISGEYGVGGALVLNHEQFLGIHGWAGEFGHVSVDPCGPKCSCGSTGCLEQYLGREALSRMAGFKQTVSMHTIHETALTDKNARAAIETAGRAFGKALASIINVTDVGHVIVGGTLAELTENLREYALEEIESRLLSARWLPPIIEKSTEGRFAAVTGGAYLAFNNLLTSPAKYLNT